MSIFSFIFGSCFGSFCCLVIQRLYAGESIVFPNSHCNHCRTALKPYELIPIVSILLLRFRCRYCGISLPKTYLFGEISGGLLFAWSFSLGISSQSLFLILWLLSGFTLSLTDLFYYHVEPRILYPTTILLLIIAWFTNIPLYWQTPLLVLLIFGCLFILRPKSFGGGDVQLLWCWSFFLSLPQLALLLFIASGLGLLAFLVSYLTKTTQKELPFVPFLWVALWMVLFGSVLPVVGVGTVFAVIMLV